MTLAREDLLILSEALEDFLMAHPDEDVADLYDRVVQELLK